MLPTQDAICTNGPSLPKGNNLVLKLHLIHHSEVDIPSDSPAATDNVRPTALVNNVRPPR